MALDKVQIFEDDFDIFVLLSDDNKVEFLYDAIVGDTRGAILKQIAKIEKSREDELNFAHVEDVAIGNHRLCITTYDNVLTFNCDSLAIINRFVNKVWSDGHILVRNNEIKKSSVDTYRYFKAFDVLKLSMPISEN